MDGITNIVPGIRSYMNSTIFVISQPPQIFLKRLIYSLSAALGGINIKALLDDAASEVGGKQLLDFNDTMGDRIQVFLE